jgi:hypothetical protein
MLLFSSADLLARFGMVRQGKARHGVAGRGKARFFFLPQGNEQGTHMKTINVTIEGVAPISFSAPVQSVKDQGEAHDVFEDRTWREKMHVENGEVFIPPGALKGCLQDAAKHLSENVPGKGSSKYTKHFERGIMVTQPLMLGVKPGDVGCDRRFVPSDGKPGGGKRVWKNFPILMTWQCDGEILVLDPLLEGKTDKVHAYLEYAGKLIGMGRFRPASRGYYGRFKVTRFDVS